VEGRSRKAWGQLERRSLHTREEMMEEEEEEEEKF
jgi:hypothetical protein